MHLLLFIDLIANLKTKQKTGNQIVAAQVSAKLFSLSKATMYAQAAVYARAYSARCKMGHRLRLPTLAI